MLPSRLSLALALELLVLCALWLELSDCLIITSVIAGNKKFKTVSFDHKWIKPLTFEKDLPSTEFRRSRTMRPPKFDIDVNIPIKLPLEDEYQQDYKKPVTSDVFFQTGEINESKGHSYGGGHPQYKSNKYTQQQQPVKYTDEQYAAASSNNQETSVPSLMREGIKGLLPALAKSIKIHPQFEIGKPSSNARADFRDSPNYSQQQMQQQQQYLQLYQEPQQVQQQQIIEQQQQPMQIINDQLQQLQQQQQQQQLSQQQEPLSPASSYPSPSYSQPQYQQQSKSYEQEFVPGGFINLQLSGPTGGPKMTYEDIDKERWAQQLSQTDGAMPYPILNYHQLQNFYGGLGTFTNGLAEHRYVQTGLLDKLKSSLNHFTSKFHFG